MLRLLLILSLLLQPFAARAANEAEQERSLQQSRFVDPSLHLKKTAVAILPFATPRNRPDLEQYGEGMMDSLITGLQNVPNFILIDRGRIDKVLKEQAFSQSGLVDPGTAVQVGKLFKAQVLINGSIRAAGSKIGIEAHFVNVKSGEIGKSESVTGALADIFDLQDQLTGRFLQVQGVTATSEQQQRITQVLKSTTSLTAYDYYLKGRKAYLLFTPAGYAEAVKWYQQATATDPRYALAYAGLAETWDFWGYQNKLNGEPYEGLYERAYTAAQQALQLNPNLAEAHRAFGRSAGALGRPGREAEVRKALALNPNDAETWYALWVDAGGNDPDQEYMRKALDLNPDLTAARNDRGAALIRLQRYDEAIAEFHMAGRLNPNDAYPHINLGAILVNLQRYDEAVAELKTALRLNPNGAPAHYNLGIALYFLKRYDEAIAAYQSALRLKTDYADAYYNLGNALYSLKRYKEAIAAYQSAVRINPDYASAIYNIGCVSALVGQRRQALAALQQAIQLDAGYKKKARRESDFSSLQQDPEFLRLTSE